MLITTVTSVTFILGVAIEAASDQSWYKYVGSHGKIIGINGYGASAPYKEIYKQFGLTAEAVANTALELN